MSTSTNDDRPPSPPSGDTSPDRTALVQSAERYESMFTHHPHAAYSVDTVGYFTDANPRALELTGLSREVILQTHFGELIHPEDLERVQDAFVGALSGVPQLIESRLVRAVDEVIDIRITAIPVVVGGEVMGVHGVAEDITDAKRLVRELEEANLAKTLFLATVSHEVRTPLAALVGATDLLLDSPLTPETTHYANLVHRSGQRLMHLVDDLLEYSGLEAHQTVLHLEPIDLRALLAGISEWAVPFASSRDLSLRFVTEESAPATMVGDVRRVTQVVTNLVQNAIVFTPQGSVVVRVRASDGWIEFAVGDTGVGIAPDDVTALFEPLTQADRFIAREHRGIGLGLAICRALTDLMGGRLEVVSEPGVGSTFTFALPLEHARR